MPCTLRLALTLFRAATWVRNKRWQALEQGVADGKFNCEHVTWVKTQGSKQGGLNSGRNTSVEDAGRGGMKKAGAKAGLVFMAGSRDINDRGEHSHRSYTQAMELPELDVIRDTDAASTKIPVLLAFSVVDPDRRLHFPLNQRIFLGLIFRHDVQHAACRYECLHFISPYPSSRVYHHKRGMGYLMRIDAYRQTWIVVIHMR
jgi:hypothetical protein